MSVEAPMRYLLAALAMAVCGSAGAQSVSNGRVSVVGLRQGGAYTGFVVRAGKAEAARVLLSGDRLVTAAACRAEGLGHALVFSGFRGRAGSGLAFCGRDRITVTLRPGDPYPRVSFDLTIRAFDPAAWQKSAGKQPFHFLAISMPEAECWHQRGWLNATPRADRFPLLEDAHVGTPEISAYHYNRNWSYTPPLGAHPLPVIGLWAPGASRYAGFEFQTTRVDDNSEREIATGYRWSGGGQIASLVYPYGGEGYQKLVLPKAGDRIASHCTLLWSRTLPAWQDPNRFVYSCVWPRISGRLPRVSRTADVSWMPGGARLKDFGGAPGPGIVGGSEGGFQEPGSRVLAGWGWHNENPTTARKHGGDTAAIGVMEKEAAELLRLAKRFKAGGKSCVYWEKPLIGSWTKAWGGPGVTTLHNSDGFAVGRLFLGLYRDCGRSDYLPVVDGVFQWARHIAWTRNEFADVPSSPFAIGGTLTAAFCLDYYETFRDSRSPSRRAMARQALDLARSFTYRYMTLWPCDNNRMDNLDATFLWEPNSGRDWTGAACANEVFWNLDTLAQTAVHTGDPILMWALQGSLERWALLYQETYRSNLADCMPGDMTEGYGLYAGNVYGVGKRAAYGFASPLFMCEPVGSSAARVLAGDRAVMVFNKQGHRTTVSDYRCSSPGNLSFAVRSTLSELDLSLTVPHVDISGRPVAVIRDGARRELEEGVDFTRPPQAVTSLMLLGVHSGDRIVIGHPSAKAPVLPSAPPLVIGPSAPSAPAGPLAPVALKADGLLPDDWSDLASWASLPRGLMWAYGVPLWIASADGPAAMTRPVALRSPLSGCRLVYVAYGAEGGARPSVILDGGRRVPVDAAKEALAWRAWPPSYTAKLLVAPAVVEAGACVVGVDPGDRQVLAMTALRAGAAVPPAVAAAIGDGAAQWREMIAEQRQVDELRKLVEGVPAGSIAILPPGPSGAVGGLIVRSGMAERGQVLSAQQLADPAVFDAKRFRVAIFVGTEEYTHTVRTPGDAADNLVRFVKEGGTLILMSGSPWPLFAGSVPGQSKSEPALTGRLGLPLIMGAETAPEPGSTFAVVPGQDVVAPWKAPQAYPSGDPRIRVIDRAAIGAGVRYTPLVEFLNPAGHPIGDAAGLLEFQDGGGRVLYIANLLQRPSVSGGSTLWDGMRYAVRAAGGK